MFKHLWNALLLSASSKFLQKKQISLYHHITQFDLRVSSSKRVRFVRCTLGFLASSRSWTLTLATFAPARLFLASAIYVYLYACYPLLLLQPVARVIATQGRDSGQVGDVDPTIIVEIIREPRARSLASLLLSSYSARFIVSRELLIYLRERTCDVSAVLSYGKSRRSMINRWRSTREGEDLWARRDMMGFDDCFFVFEVVGPCADWLWEKVLSLW